MQEQEQEQKQEENKEKEEQEQEDNQEKKEQQKQDKEQKNFVNWTEAVTNMAGGDVAIDSVQVYCHSCYCMTTWRVGTRSLLTIFSLRYQ